MWVQRFWSNRTRELFLRSVCIPNAWYYRRTIPGNSTYRRYINTSHTITLFYDNACKRIWYNRVDENLK